MALRFPKNLVLISPRIWATHAAWYGPKRKFLRSLFPRFTEDVAKIEKELKLGANHSFIFRNLSNPCLGLTYPSCSKTFIDPRRYSYDEVLYTTCHESLHLKQVQDGKLLWNKEELSLTWKGKPIENIISLTSANKESYNSLPWEQDVIKKQSKLYVKLFNKFPPYSSGIKKK